MAKEESRLEKDGKESKELGKALDKWFDLGEKSDGKLLEAKKVYYPHLSLQNDQIPEKLQKLNKSGIAEIEYDVESIRDDENGKSVGLAIKKIRIK